MKTFILNGWAATPEAWRLCRFRRDAIFSYTDHLEGVTRKAFLELEGPAILVGWSMGGSFALRLALEKPGKVRALILIGATPRMMKDDDWAGMTPRRLAALEAGLRLTMMGKGFATIPPGAPNPYMIDSDENLARGLDYLRETDLRRDLLENREKFANIEVSIFQAERDPIVRKENAAFLASVFPNAKVEMIPSAEHALPIIIPEKIDAAIEAIG